MLDSPAFFALPRARLSNDALTNATRGDLCAIELMTLARQTRITHVVQECGAKRDYTPTMTIRLPACSTSRW